MGSGQYMHAAEFLEKEGLDVLVNDLVVTSFPLLKGNSKILIIIQGIRPYSSRFYDADSMEFKVLGYVLDKEMMQPIIQNPNESTKIIDGKFLGGLENEMNEYVAISSVLDYFLARPDDPESRPRSFSQHQNAQKLLRNN